MSTGKESRNILARYIKNEPQVTIPILTSAVFIGALINKKGYFDYHNIPISYVDFNIFQFFVNDMLVIILTGLFLLLLCGLIYLIGEIAISRREVLETNNLYSTKESKVISKNNIKDDFAIMIIILIDIFVGFAIIFYLDKISWVFLFMILIFVTFIPLFYCLIIKRFYAIALLTISLQFLIICYISGYMNGKVTVLDIACVEGEKFKVIDYYDDKYILKPTKDKSEYFKVSNLNNSPVSVFNTREVNDISCNSSK
ncbi:hypothetical protein IQ283_02160 [Alkalihalobacillus hwajinpoensis]|uniref:hypothetical protein n=1 Tax=Guptibacillus hwajinpoensis TaxID=208199 RepID=UPI0018843848|nr:hypothetical protein [Pseudalkalibacillus hwajinpoensis]MBF0705394.1 hypothetical protein [Pseudalkalibacillus hwajinpoensis]